MGRESEPRTLVLHALRVHGLVDIERIVADTGLDQSDVRGLLDDMVSTDLAMFREGARPGFLLTPAGRRAEKEAMRDELDATATRERIEADYRSFRALNDDLLAVCNAWQMRTVDGLTSRNDHADPAYDREVIERLVDLDSRARPIFDDLADALARFSRFGPAFSHAVECLLEGDRNWFTKPMFPSYHTLWFELHEDLLATLGLERSSELG